MVSTLPRRLAPLLVLMAGCSSAGNFAGKESAGEGSVDEALAAPHKIAESRPKAPAGRTGAQPGRPDPAIESARRTQAIAEYLAEAGRAEQSQNLPAARSAYERVLQVDPDHIRANYELAKLADNEGRFADSARHYQVLVRQTPRNADLLASLGWSYFLQERYEDSERTLRDALAIDPHNRTAHGNLGWLLGTRGDYDGALAELRAGESETDAQRDLAELFPAGRPASARIVAGEAPRNPFGQTADSAAAARGPLPRAAGQPARGIVSAPAPRQQQGVAGGAVPGSRSSIVPAGGAGLPREGARDAREFDELSAESDPQAGGIRPAGYDRPPPSSSRAAFPQITPRAGPTNRAASAPIAFEQVEPTATIGGSALPGSAAATAATGRTLPDWPHRADAAPDRQTRSADPAPRAQNPLSAAAQLGLAAGPGGLLFSPTAPR